MWGAFLRLSRRGAQHNGTPSISAAARSPSAVWKTDRADSENLGSIVPAGPGQNYCPQYADTCIQLPLPSLRLVMSLLKTLTAHFPPRNISADAPDALWCALLLVNQSMLEREDSNKLDALIARTSSRTRTPRTQRYSRSHPREEHPGVMCDILRSIADLCKGADCCKSTSPAIHALISAPVEYIVYRYNITCELSQVLYYKSEGDVVPSPTGAVFARLCSP